MTILPNCPKCGSEHTYPDVQFLVCPECSHEWNEAQPKQEIAEQTVARDANGNLLADGDTVTVIKDLKIKGSSAVVKVGMKVKNVRIVEGDHNIDCYIDGIGDMSLKSQFVKKVS